MDSDDAPDDLAFPFVIVRECPGKADKIVGWYADLAAAKADLASARVISWREGARFYIRESRAAAGPAAPAQQMGRAWRRWTLGTGDRG